MGEDASIAKDQDAIVKMKDSLGQEIVTLDVVAKHPSEKSSGQKDMPIDKAKEPTERMSGQEGTSIGKVTKMM